MVIDFTKEYLEELSLKIDVKVKYIKMFLNYVEIPDDANACWDWNFFKTKKGYPVFRGKNYLFACHRLSWMIFNASLIPKDMCVCHTCDNRICCKPEHLWIGTRGENIRDMLRKGRGASWAKKLAGKLRVKKEKLEHKKKHRLSGISCADKNESSST